MANLISLTVWKDTGGAVLSSSKTISFSPKRIIKAITDSTPEPAAAVTIIYLKDGTQGGVTEYAVAETVAAIVTAANDKSEAILVSLTVHRDTGGALLTTPKTMAFSVGAIVKMIAVTDAEDAAIETKLYIKNGFQGGLEEYSVAETIAAIETAANAHDAIV